jgi:hypothetical protein
MCPNTIASGQKTKAITSERIAIVLASALGDRLLPGAGLLRPGRLLG